MKIRDCFHCFSATNFTKKKAGSLDLYYLSDGVPCKAPKASRIFCIALSLFFLISIGGSASAGEIDRLIVAVNGRVLTQGDLDLARSLNAILLNEKSDGTTSRDEEIERLVDLELMRQELKNFSVTQEDETRIEGRLQSLRDAYSEKGGLVLLLRQLGLQESELASYLRFESSMLKFVDFRFRPFVSVSEEEVRNYYETRLTPQLQKARLDPPVVAQVSAKIEEILKEEKINALLEQWIKEIRRNSRIEYFNSAGDSVTSGPESTK